MNFEWLVQIVRDVFRVETTAGVVIWMAIVGAIVGASAGYAIETGRKAAEVRRLLESAPEFLSRYVVTQGSVAFRIDTLDQDLKRIGIRVDGMSSPQAAPTPHEDNVPQEYFQLRNGTFLRLQWRGGQRMPPETRTLAERVILAHEARLEIR